MLLCLSFALFLQTHWDHTACIYVCRVIRGINSDSVPRSQSGEFYEKVKNDLIPVGVTEFSLVWEWSWPDHRMLQLAMRGNSVYRAG